MKGDLQLLSRTRKDIEKKMVLSKTRKNTACSHNPDKFVVLGFFFNYSIILSSLILTKSLGNVTLLPIIFLKLIIVPTSYTQASLG